MLTSFFFAACADDNKIQESKTQTPKKTLRTHKY